MSQAAATRGIVLLSIPAIVLVGVGVAMIVRGPFTSDRAFGTTILAVGALAALAASLLLPGKPATLDPSADEIPGWTRPRTVLAAACVFAAAAAVAAWIGTLSAIDAGTGRGAITWWAMPVVMTPMALYLVVQYVRGAGRHRLVAEGDLLVHEHARGRDTAPWSDIDSVRHEPGPPAALVLVDRAHQTRLVLNPRHFDATVDDLARWLDHQKVRP